LSSMDEVFEVARNNVSQVLRAFRITRAALKRFSDNSPCSADG